MQHTVHILNGLQGMTAGETKPQGSVQCAISHTHGQPSAALLSLQILCCRGPCVAHKATSYASLKAQVYVLQTGIRQHAALPAVYAATALQGMKAGENTLNAICTRVVMRGMAAAGGWVAG
jgi:hypothetical protein